MAVCEIHTAAQTSLQRQTSITVIVPDEAPGPFPVLYLLHGLSGNHTVWTRRTSIERYVQDLPLMIVMPDCGRWWYTNSASQPFAAHEDAVVEDLVAFIDRTYRTIPDRAGRAIGGQSMGGYGALKLSLKHPELFCAAFSQSGALILADALAARPEWEEEFKVIFGDELCGGDADLLAIAERAAGKKLPDLWLDCGREDWLLENNRRMHAHLQALDIPHEYHENPGEHSWAYWDLHVQDVLPWLVPRLGL